MPTSSPLRVHQRAAGVAGVDGGVGLHEVLVGLDAQVRAAHGRDDAERDRLAQLKRVANGQHPLRHLQARRVAPGNGRQVARVHLQQRQVGRRIDADDGGGHLALVGSQRHADGQVLDADAPLIAGDDVVVGEDEPVGADHDAGPQAALDAAARAEDVVVAEEERVERRWLPAHELLGRDVGDGRHRAVGDAGEVGERRGGGHRAGRRDVGLPAAAALLLVLDRRRVGRTIAGVRKHAAGCEAERQDDGEREQAPHGHLL